MYQQWTDLCSTLLVNTALKDPSVPHIELVQVYGKRVRHTHYSKRRVGKIGKQLVSQTWGAIAATHLLDGLPDPINSLYSQSHTRLGRHLARQLKS